MPQWFGVLWVAAACAASRHGGKLGPGRGQWLTDTPENHGLSTRALEAAAKRVRENAPERFCLLVAKDGKLIHESYFANTSETLYELDSAAKTFVAGVVGAAVQQSGLDLHRTLESYGVPSNAVWNRTGVDFFPEVTAHHLLSQTNGFGLVKPGTYFTYNSEDYIQHLSPLVAAVTNRTALDFANHEFAEPLGVPNLFLFDDLPGDEISAGGGQMSTCSDLLRLGQLVLNQGSWLDRSGAPYQLLPEAYVKTMTSPAHDFAPTYGYLTWLNRPVGDAHCCAPRWGGKKKLCVDGEGCAECCTPVGEPGNISSPRFPCKMLPTLSNTCGEHDVASITDKRCVHHAAQWVDANFIGENIVGSGGLEGAPADTVVAMGNLAKYMLAIPSLNVTVVSIGHSSGVSLACDGGYDDAQTLSVIWDAIASAVGNPLAASRDPVKKAARGPRPAWKDSGTATVSTVDNDDPAAESTSLLTSHPRLVRQRMLPSTVSHGPAAVATDAAAATNGSGSCYCTCPPAQGFGVCLNVPSSTAPVVRGDCTTVPGWSDKTTSPLWKATDVCPAWGQAVECNVTNEPPGTGCGHCDEVTPCRPVHPGSSFAVKGCSCRSPALGPCSWSPDPCVYTPYFPPM